jgi:hypothetical protein
MKTINHQELSDLIRLKTFSERAIVYIWMMLNPNPIHFSKTNPLEMDLSRLAKYLRPQKSISNKISENLSNGLIPDHELDWITESKRQFKWIELNINHFCNAPGSRLAFATAALPFRARSIGLFDYKSLDPGFQQYREGTASQVMRLEWSKQLKRDRNFIWVNSSGQNFERDYFWEYLEKYKPELIDGKPQFNTYDELLIFFDETNLEQIKIIELNKQVQKAWKQKQRRSDPIKQPCNCELNSTTIDKLEILSQKHGSSRTAIIEILINSESISEHHIKNHLKDRLK